MPERNPIPNQPQHVDEFVIEASVELLNSELVNRGIGPDCIIAVLPVPGQTMANPTPPKFRVLYRAD